MVAPNSLHLKRKYARIFVLRADLHGTTLSYNTSLRRAYDMTKDHLHAHDIFTY